MGISFGLLKVLRKWYCAAGSVRNTRLASALRAGFQHCSMGLSSGVNGGKYTNLNVFLCRRQNSSTSLPWCAGPLSRKSRTRPQRRSASIRKRMKSRCLLRLLKMYANPFRVLAPKTFVQTFLWLIRTTGLLPRRAQPRVTSGIKPKVASSWAATTNPCRRYSRTNRRVFF